MSTWVLQYVTNTWTHTRVLTGVKEDHGLEADVLLPLQLELSHSWCGGYQHIKDLQEALHTAPFFSVVRHKRFTDVQKTLLVLVSVQKRTKKKLIWSKSGAIRMRNLKREVRFAGILATASTLTQDPDMMWSERAWWTPPPSLLTKQWYDTLMVTATITDSVSWDNSEHFVPVRRSWALADISYCNQMCAQM